MCQLLGLSANQHIDINFSLTGLIQRGGVTDNHSDGWGIAYYDGKSCQLFRDPLPSSESKIAQFLRRHPINSDLIIGHIRKANRGRVCLANTHPFERELWGRRWVFAHNGQLKGIKKLPLSRFQPVGTTDSEYAFCWLLGKVAQQFPKPPKTEQQLWDYLHYLCLNLGGFGAFNILLSDSRLLYAFCSTKLACLNRRAPFGIAKLKDAEVQIDLSEANRKGDVITVIATEPLTDNEKWIKMNRNEMRAYRKGVCVFQRTWE